MKPGRYFFISKNFWPVSGETELLATAFAKCLQRQVRQVDIVTWRMVRQWPDHFQFGKSRVFRLPASQRSSWSASALGYYGRNRWHRSLQRWAISAASEYSGGIVFEFPEDGLAPSILLGRAGCPIVSRINQVSIADLPRQSFRDLRNLKTGSVVANPISFVTSDASIKMDTMANPGEPLEHLRVIADGYPDRAQPIGHQMASRKILAAVHPIFQLDPGALLLVCGAQFSFESGVFSLVRAWRSVLSKYPNARLWLIGAGSSGSELYRRICDLDLQHSVLLTGNFDDPTDVFAAADGYVIPGTECGGWYAGLASRLGNSIIHHQKYPVPEIQDAGNFLSFDDHARPIEMVLGHWADSVVQKRGLTNFQPAVLPNPPSSRSLAVMPDQDNANGQSMRQMVREYLELLESQQVGT